MGSCLSLEDQIDKEISPPLQKLHKDIDAMNAQIANMRCHIDRSINEIRKKARENDESALRRLQTIERTVWDLSRQMPDSYDSNGRHLATFHR